MEDYNINTVGRGPIVQGIEGTIEGWQWIGSLVKESFSAVSKAYDPVQEMLMKEHEKGLEMMADTDQPEEMRKDASQHVRESRDAAQKVAANRMADVLKIVGAVATVTAAALGGTQYIKYVGR